MNILVLWGNKAHDNICAVHPPCRRSWWRSCCAASR